MAVTDWLLPGTAASVDRDGKNTWYFPDRIKVDDNSSAYAYVPQKDYCDWLRATNFGFVNLIPPNATIDGIEVKIKRYCSTGNNMQDSSLRLRKSSGQVGDDKASATYWPTTLDEATYGGSTDLWGTSWSAQDINNTNFGVDLSAYNANPTTAKYANVDCIKVRVYYTPSTVINVGGLGLYLIHNRVFDDKLLGALSLQILHGNISVSGMGLYLLVDPPYIIVSQSGRVFPLAPNQRFTQSQNGRRK